MAQDPTLREHLFQGKRNEKIAQWLFPIAPDWAIVILFYASVRYASALEIHLGWKVSRSHFQRIAQLRRGRYHLLANLYRNAYEISRKWRYQSPFFLPPSFYPKHPLFPQ